jgi:hypothetical protein
MVKFSDEERAALKKYTLVELKKIVARYNTAIGIKNYKTLNKAQLLARLEEPDIDEPTLRVVLDHVSTLDLKTVVKPRGPNKATLAKATPARIEKAKALDLEAPPTKDGFYEMISRKTGRTYYFNPTTGKSTFTLPAGAKKLDAPPRKTPPAK